jgi:hypothetical protein
MLSEVTQFYKGKDHISSHMWKIDPNTNANITIYTHKYMGNMFPKVELLEETEGGGKEEKNDRE